MKIAVDYLNDRDGNVKAVQLPLRDWEKVLSALKRYERAGKAPKQTLDEFLAAR